MLKRRPKGDKKASWGTYGGQKGAKRYRKVCPGTLEAPLGAMRVQGAFLESTEET